MTAYLVFCTTRPLDDPKGVMRELLDFLQPSRVLSAWRASRFEVPRIREPKAPIPMEWVLGDVTMSAEARGRLEAAAGRGGCLTVPVVSPFGERLVRAGLQWSQGTGPGSFQPYGLDVYVGETEINVSQHGEECFAKHATAAVVARGGGATPDPKAARASILELPIVQEIAEGLTPILGDPEVLIWWDEPPYEPPKNPPPRPEREPTAMEVFLAPIEPDDPEIPFPGSVMGKCQATLMRFDRAFEELHAVYDDPDARPPAIAAFAEALADLFLCNDQIEEEDLEEWTEYIRDRVTHNLNARF